MVYYADGTIIISRSKSACESLLIGNTDRISAQYGLKLNKGTCVNFNMNGAEQTSYLGNTLNAKASLRE